MTGLAGGTDTLEHGAQVLDELERLATVEHALVVEYLSVCYALGHDLEADEGGATTSQGRNAASAASILALGDMIHLKRISNVLVAAGRFAELGRATSIPTSSASVPWAPPTATELQHLLEREEWIASAVDALYMRLRHGLTSVTDLDSHVIDEVRAVVDDAATHATAVAALRDSLGDLSPDDYLRATRREAADPFEQRLLDLSDRIYGLILASLQDRFAPRSPTGPGLATSAMDTLHDANRILVQRGLLPPFTLS